MFLSLRAKIFVAFALVGLVMTVVTVLAVRALDDQVQTTVAATDREAGAAEAIASLRALPVETEGLIQSHLHATTSAEKTALTARLVAADTREALAFAALTEVAQGAEVSLVADLQLQARQAAGLRERLVAISTRNALGEAMALATRAMPGLRGEITQALQDVAAQGGDGAGAAQAEAALNAIAAAQKNALLNPDPAYVTGQLSAVTMARADLQAAVAGLDATGAPGLAGLHRALHDLQALDNRMELLLRDSGADTAAAILSGQLQPLDQRRLDALEGLAALVETGQRSADSAAVQEAAALRTTLILLADMALLIGFGAVMLGLGKIGRGMEAAVKLAEQVAEVEVAAPTWVRGNLAGRLTSALVRISAGQAAVLASLEAVAQGRPPRADLPERMRHRLVALAQGLDLRGALAEAEALRDAAAQLADQLRAEEGRHGPRIDALSAEMQRHHLATERQLASLQALAPAPPPLRRIA